MKLLYSYLRSKMKSSTRLPSLVDQSGASFISDAEKANALAAHFASVFSPDHTCSIPDFQDVPSIIHRCNDVRFDPVEVSRFLRSLKPSITETFDGIPQIVYKKCASSLSTLLAHIFNISMLLGEVPGIWKEAIITAISKSPGTNLLSDFRPISLLPTPVKVMEKIIREKLLSLFQRFYSIPLEQHGFTVGASTVTNLLDSVYDWVSARNRGESVDVIYIDLSKAFDKVCHSKLIARLQHLGIHGRLLDWLCSYFHKRNMTVKVRHQYSTKFPCSSGVPQGGALSPLLFLVYTLDLPNILKSSPPQKNPDVC
ncbi:hypothetical protein Y032_0100g3316 [Ancylostoma ceylanicum]|uniref:Reverse transcriptase domain-containing protein n=1 Tax=Ancylostoma ceylanicum TaxID=53326 RepID=A0A016THL3_9BILA|nr:hypothetical protein Y032_0100g3316 [Ancylostoma ceylanicum]